MVNHRKISSAVVYVTFVSSIKAPITYLLFRVLFFIESKAERERERGGGNGSTFGLRTDLACQIFILLYKNNVNYEA